MDQTDILKEIKNFYSSLYAKRNQETSKYNFFDDSIYKLKEENKLKCEGKLTLYECEQALKQMKNNKSPGSDGITIEFYNTFWDDIKTHILNSLNYSFDNGKLSELQSQSLITLLPKQDKDTTLLSNWRPISLLNTDYKIGTKALANRMKDVLPEIISHTQTGFVKGRYIGESVRLLEEVLDYVETNNIPCLLFFSDFEKAFDSVDHDYLLETLKHLNFGENFIKWIKVFYTNAHSCVLNNGHMTDGFNIERGVRQGCPLSPYLFITAIELLSYQIEHNQTVKGIDIENIHIKIHCLQTTRLL